jgi:Transglutaminase-like superfamily
MREILAFYSEPVAGESAALFNALPADVASLARIVPGLMLHQHIGPAYGEPIAPERLAEAQLRPVDDILACVLKHDGAALSRTRPPSKRVIGVCRHFSLLLVAMLRHKHIPARARCGFGSYFEKGKFIDHWVAEYWNGTRWVMVDAQMDEVQRKLFRIDFDPLDVPHDRFLIAGDAWTQCRAGKADPDAFGLLDMHGWAFIAGNVVRDVAALNNAVMLPWDIWGAMPQLGETPEFARFDAWAELTREPDVHFAELRKLYQTDAIKVPPVVFNAVLQRHEPVPRTP